MTQRRAPIASSTVDVYPQRADVRRDVLLVVLSACSGALDAAAYLRFHTFTANMTGNTVVLGLALGGKRAGDATHAAVALAAFFAGALIGAALGAKADRSDRWPAALLRPFAVEIALLAAFAGLWRTAGAPVLLALGAGAMGLQSAVTRDVHSGGVSTTYMSGTLARIGELVADSIRAGIRGGLALSAFSWLAYLVVAIGMGALDAAGGNTAGALWALTAVVLAIALAGRRLVQRDACDDDTSANSEIC